MLAGFLRDVPVAGDFGAGLFKAVACRGCDPAVADADDLSAIASCGLGHLLAAGAAFLPDDNPRRTGGGGGSIG
ncbi:MAG: hypothetical protein EAY70_02850 [Sphingomonadales bacterium]|nr:MAG: hypothetical protein EAY70_02850 [Sphingomonadales bacterium]